MLLGGAALVLTVVGLIIGLVSDAVPAAVAGWLIAGPIAITVLGVFLHVDTTRRAAPLYADTGVVPWLMRATVLLSIAAVLVNAYPVAESLARA